LKKFLPVILLFIVFSNAWADVSIQNDQQYLGNDGALHIVGEIENNFNAPINQIEIKANLFSKGVLIDTANSHSMLNTIMPKMKGPFDILVSGEDAKHIDEYSLEINYKITEPKNQVIDIIETDFVRDESDNLVIKGTVANRGDITANTIVVVATLYDRDGKVAAVSKSHVAPDYLGAEEQSFFFVSVPDKSNSNSIIDYTVVAESEEYTAVPEFPIGSMIFLATSVSAYVILTRYSSRVTVNLVSATGSK
jgi:hypothetical protein